MKENVLDVLVYLFQSFLVESENQSGRQAAQSDQPVTTDRDSMVMDLQEAGFSLVQINKAFDWMDGLAARQTTVTMPTHLHSMRYFSHEEMIRLDMECRGFLLYLEQVGILDPVSRELVIDRVMALESRSENRSESGADSQFGTDDFDAEDLKWVVLMVLFNQPGQEDAYVWMENLVFENFTGYVN